MPSAGGWEHPSPPEQYIYTPGESWRRLRTKEHVLPLNGLRMN